MAKYTGVTQNKDGAWSYRIKKKVDGKVIDTKIKKDDSGMPFLTARACYEAKIRHEAPRLPMVRLKSLTGPLKRHYRAFTMHTWFPVKQNRKHLPPFASRNQCGRTMCSLLSGTKKSNLSKSQTLMTSCMTYTASKASPIL